MPRSIASCFDSPTAVVVSIVLLATALAQSLQAQDLPKNDASPGDETTKQVELPSGTPPWKKKAQEPGTDVPAAPPSFRAALSNVDDSDLAGLKDHEPLDPADPTLRKVFYQMPRVGLDQLERFAAANNQVDLSSLAEDPESHRLVLLPLAGRVTEVSLVKLPAELARYSEFAHYFLVTFTPQGSKTSVLIHALKIPRAWKPGQELNEKASCLAAFLKVGDSQLLFASPRIAWLPEKVNDKLAITQSLVLLAKTGMDVGLFDDVRELNGERVGPKDSECFYQLLAAAGRIGPKPQLGQDIPPLDLVPALSAPKTQHGKLVIVEGNARRITRIAIDAPYIRDRLGIDHYFEIDVFIPLGNRDIKISGKQKDGAAPVFQNNYPVTVCVRQLPAGIAEGSDVSQSIRVACFYFKLWAYKSQFIRDFGEGSQQVSPLLIGFEPEVVEYGRMVNPYFGAGLVVVIVLAMGGIWAGLWFTKKGDDKFSRDKLQSQFEVAKGKSLDDMGIEASDGPDFSGLD